MLTRRPVSLDQMVDTLKAAAESSRLRILVLLSHGDLTVSDITHILGQSQPRVSRHLKLLLDAALIDRYQEGSWAYFRLADSEAAREFVHGEGHLGRRQRLTAALEGRGEGICDCTNLPRLFRQEIQSSYMLT
jgi:ArsR family transcriptional regulator